MIHYRILSVGQCSADQSSIERFFQREFQASVKRADSGREAIDQLREREYDLVLVNRVLDFDASPGVDLIRAIKSDPEHSCVPVMLVSNFVEAQEEAVEAGALRGFGKASLHTQEVRSRLTELLLATRASE